MAIIGSFRSIAKRGRKLFGSLLVASIVLMFGSVGSDVTGVLYLAMARLS